MATAPVYASVPVEASALMGTFDTSTTAPTNVTTLSWSNNAAGNAPTYPIMVREVRFTATATVVDAVLNCFLYDGTTYHLFDQLKIDATTYSTTAIGWRRLRLYQNVIIPNSTWSLRFSHTVTTNNSLISIDASGLAAG